MKYSVSRRDNPPSRVNEVFFLGDLIIACGLANLGFRAFFPLRETASYYDEALDCYSVMAISRSV